MRVIRLLLELRDDPLFIRHHYAEAARLFLWHRHDRNGYGCILLFVVIQHHLVVHLVDMVAGQDQYIVRIKALHVFDILIDGIGCAGVPVSVYIPLKGREHRHSSHVPVQIPGYAYANMGVESERLILRQHTDGIYA